MKADTVRDMRRIPLVMALRGPPFGGRKPMCYGISIMRLIGATLLLLSLDLAYAQGVPIEPEVMEKDLVEFSNRYYPGLEIDPLTRLSPGYGFGFSYVDEYERSIYACGAFYYGNAGEVLLIYCVDPNSRAWPPPTYPYAFIKEDGRLVDSIKEIFPIADIFDQLQGFIIDHERVQYLLNKDKDSPSLHNYLIFEESESGVDVLVSIRPIEGVIEGAAYASMVWDDEMGRFRISD